MDDIASGLQEFLICIEMFFAAMAHAFAFPPKDYMDPNGQQPRGILRNIRIMFDVRDVVDDVQGAVDHGVLAYRCSGPCCIIVKVLVWICSNM